MKNGNLHVFLEREKPDIDNKKPDIGISNKITNKTLQHFITLQESLDNQHIFGRTEVETILSLKSSSASEFIKKMLNMNYIIPVTGHGKGKYRLRTNLSNNL